MRITGTYAISTTLGEAVHAFVPYALPPRNPVLAPESFVEANRRQGALRRSNLSDRDVVAQNYDGFTALHHFVEYAARVR